MKQFFKLMCLLTICGVGVTVQAGFDCDERYGQIIKGNNGIEYCRSNRTMNWWTAVGWCQEIGGTLISYPSDCQHNNDTSPNSVCPNLKNDINIGYIWTNTPSLDNGAYAIHTTYDWICTANSATCGHVSKRTHTNYALCKN